MTCLYGETKSTNMSQVKRNINFNIQVANQKLLLLHQQLTFNNPNPDFVSVIDVHYDVCIHVSIFLIQIEYFDTCRCLIFQNQQKLYVVNKIGSCILHKYFLPRLSTLSVPEISLTSSSLTSVLCLCVRTNVSAVLQSGATTSAEHTPCKHSQLLGQNNCPNVVLQTISYPVHRASPIS